MSIWLKVLTNQELELLLSDILLFEETTGLHYDGEELSGHIRIVFSSLLKPESDKKQDTVFDSLCAVVNESLIVGSLALRGHPNSDGYVEVGYGLGKGHRGKGIMTLAFKQYMDLLSREQTVKTIIAHTDPENIPSQRVLEKNGFLRSGLEDGEFLWIYTK